MSDVAPANAPDLGELVRETDDSDGAALGFHHRHVADVGGIVEVARRFIDAGYVLEMITCTDLRFVPDAEPVLRLSYTYNRHRAGEVDRHLIVVDLASGATAPSIVDITPAADWLEREVYDMFGVRFDGHPDLKRILLPDDSDFHALLKDFGRIDDVEDDAEEDAS